MAVYARLDSRFGAIRPEVILILRLVHHNLISVLLWHIGRLFCRRLLGREFNRGVGSLERKPILCRRCGKPDGMRIERRFSPFQMVVV